jgi:hypothetical protein
MHHFEEALLKFDRNRLAMIIDIMHTKILEHKKTNLIKHYQFNQQFCIHEESMNVWQAHSTILSSCNQSGCKDKAERDVDMWWIYHKTQCD